MSVAKVKDDALCQGQCDVLAEAGDVAGVVDGVLASEEESRSEAHVHPTISRIWLEGAGGVVDFPQNIAVVEVGRVLEKASNAVFDRGVGPSHGVI